VRRERVRIMDNGEIQALHYIYVSESEISDALETLGLQLPEMDYLETAEKIVSIVTEISDGDL
jgi:hypothetical protein